MTRWEPDPSTAASVREAFAAGGTVHTVSALLGVTPPTLKRASERLPWLAEAIATGRLERGRPHGSLARYAAGCRCAGCREANTADVRERRAARQRVDMPPDVRHGSAATYTNWGCRCDQCRAANTAKSIARRSRTQNSAPLQPEP